MRQNNENSQNTEPNVLMIPDENEYQKNKEEKSYQNELSVTNNIEKDIREINRKKEEEKDDKDEDKLIFKKFTGFLTCYKDLFKNCHFKKYEEAKELCESIVKCIRRAPKETKVMESLLSIPNLTRSSLFKVEMFYEIENIKFNSITILDNFASYKTEENVNMIRLLCERVKIIKEKNKLVLYIKNNQFHTNSNHFYKILECLIALTEGEIKNDNLCKVYVMNHMKVFRKIKNNFLHIGSIMLLLLKYLTQICQLIYFIPDILMQHFSLKEGNFISCIFSFFRKCKKYFYENLASHLKHFSYVFDRILQKKVLLYAHFVHIENGKNEYNKGKDKTSMKNICTDVMAVTTNNAKKREWKNVAEENSIEGTQKSRKIFDDSIYLLSQQNTGNEIENISTFNYSDNYYAYLESLYKGFQFFNVTGIDKEHVLKYCHLYMFAFISKFCNIFFTKKINEKKLPLIAQNLAFLFNAKYSSYTLSLCLFNFVKSIDLEKIMTFKSYIAEMFDLDYFNQMKLSVINYLLLYLSLILYPADFPKDIIQEDVFPLMKQQEEENEKAFINFEATFSEYFLEKLKYIKPYLEYEEEKTYLSKKIITLIMVLQQHVDHSKSTTRISSDFINMSIFQNFIFCFYFAKKDSVISNQLKALYKKFSFKKPHTFLLSYIWDNLLKEKIVNVDVDVSKKDSIECDHYNQILPENSPQEFAEDVPQKNAPKKRGRKKKHHTKVNPLVYYHNKMRSEKFQLRYYIQRDIAFICILHLNKLPQYTPQKENWLLYVKKLNELERHAYIQCEETTIDESETEIGKTVQQNSSSRAEECENNEKQNTLLLKDTFHQIFVGVKEELEKIERQRIFNFYDDVMKRVVNAKVAHEKFMINEYVRFFLKSIEEKKDLRCILDVVLYYINYETDENSMSLWRIHLYNLFIKVIFQINFDYATKIYILSKIKNLSDLLLERYTSLGPNYFGVYRKIFTRIAGKANSNKDNSKCDYDNDDKDDDDNGDDDDYWNINQNINLENKKPKYKARTHVLEVLDPRGKKLTKKYTEKNLYRNLYTKKIFFDSKHLCGLAGADTIMRLDENRRCGVLIRCYASILVNFPDFVADKAPDLLNGILYENEKFIFINENNIFENKFYNLSKEKKDSYVKKILTKQDELISFYHICYILAKYCADKTLNNIYNFFMKHFKPNQYGNQNAYFFPRSAIFNNCLFILQHVIAFMHYIDLQYIQGNVFELLFNALKHYEYHVHCHIERLSKARGFELDEVPAEYFYRYSKLRIPAFKAINNIYKEGKDIPKALDYALAVDFRYEETNLVNALLYTTAKVSCKSIKQIYKQIDTYLNNPTFEIKSNDLENTKTVYASRIFYLYYYKIYKHFGIVYGAFNVYHPPLNTNIKNTIDMCITNGKYVVGLLDKNAAKQQSAHVVHRTISLDNYSDIENENGEEIGESEEDGNDEEHEEDQEEDKEKGNGEENGKEIINDDDKIRNSGKITGEQKRQRIKKKKKGELVTKWFWFELGYPALACLYEFISNENREQNVSKCLSSTDFDLRLDTIINCFDFFLFLPRIHASVDFSNAVNEQAILESEVFDMEETAVLILDLLRLIVCAFYKNCLKNHERIEIITMRLSVKASEQTNKEERNTNVALSIIIALKHTFETIGYPKLFFAIKDMYQMFVEFENHPDDEIEQISKQWLKQISNFKNVHTA